MDQKVKALLPLMSWLRDREVTVLSLPGGLTNRNYCLTCRDDRFVLRILRKNAGLLSIDRQAENSNASTAFAAGIGAEVMAFFPRQRAMITRFVAGQVLDSQAMQSPAVLRRVVSSVRRCHESSASAGNFWAFETVRRYYAEARSRNVPFPRGIHRALKHLAQIEEVLGPPAAPCLCHNDLLAANLVDDGQKVWILDWEYAGAGDLFFDLANLAANNLFNRAQEKRLLQYYFGAVRPADLRRLRLMRLASDMREAMWGFLQIGIADLDFDYSTYARHHFLRFMDAAEHLALLR